MRFICLTLLLSVTSVTGFSQMHPAPVSQAEERIAFVNREIKKSPGKANLYNELAIALLHRERETSDRSLFSQVQAALDESLKLAPSNLEAQKVEAGLLLEKHEFSDALKLAKSINRQVPDDVMTYGYIGDADMALGEYADAEKAAQWMLNLRTHNVPGLIRGAALRGVFGDPDGALQFLSDAYQQTSPEESEQTAWLLTRMAEISLSAGKLDLAGQYVQKALASLPDYFFALEVEARLRSAEKRYSEAGELLHLRNRHFPQTHTIYAEAEAWEKSGKTGDAEKMYAAFEAAAISESDRAENDNLDLVFFYLDHKHDAREALRIARVERARRHDNLTLDALAAALYRSGDYLNAQKEIERAMASGVSDGDIFYHAAEISVALQDRPVAMKYLKLSLQANAESTSSDDARRMLAKIAPDYGKER